ncbi:hypothetical protein KHA80_10360 [Anaerobacillus sp. HL2]|nr:hypothetical protein KHA80_10360 [Anaerobacillus sp. HL2]
MCVIKELKELGPGLRRALLRVWGKKIRESSLKTKIKGISYVLVSFIVNSFERLDVVEEYVKSRFQ